MNAVDVCKMIYDVFANTGECISALGNCEVCKYHRTCDIVNIAYIMVLDGEYYG